MPERRFRQVDAFSTDEMQRNRALSRRSRGSEPAGVLVHARLVAWGGGHTRQGVAASNAAGRGLADPIRGVDSDLTRLPWVGRRSRVWEPEPFRWLAVHAVASIGHVTGWRDRRRSS